jgi:hypothetical protein
MGDGLLDAQSLYKNIDCLIVLLWETFFGAEMPINAGAFIGQARAEGFSRDTF